MNRRTFLKAAAGTAMLGAGSVLDGCSGQTVSRPAPDYPRLTLQLGDTVSPPHPIFSAEEYFQNRVQAGSRGAINVELRPNSSLGGEVALLQQLVEGTLPLAAISTGTLATLVPQVAVWDLPFAFVDQGHVRSAQEGPLGKRTADLLRESGVGMLAWFDGTDRSVTFGTEARITSPADLVGVPVLFINGSRGPLVDALQGMGARVEFSPDRQLYPPLLTGVAAVRRVVIGHAFAPLLVSVKWLAGQPKQVQDLVAVSGRDTQNRAREIFAQAESMGRKDVSVDRPDLLAFQRSAAVQQVWSEAGPPLEPLYSLLKKSL